MIKKILYLIALFLFCLFGFLSYEYLSFIQQRNELVHEKGSETTITLRNQVDTILSKIVAEGEQLANLLGGNEYSESQIREMIKASALRIPEIQGVTACFEPDAFSDNKRLFCPYYNKGTQDFISVEDSYDYTIKGKGTAWYTGVRDEGAKWVEPYFANAAQDWYVDYGIPFYFISGPNKGKVRGTITMSFVCGGFKNLVHSLSLGKTGYGVITSNEGMFLVHPINEYIGTTNLKTIKNKETNNELIKAYEGLLAGESGQTEFYDKELQGEVLFYYDKIPASGWGIGLLFFKEDLFGDSSSLNRRYIQLVLVFSALLFFLFIIYFGKDFLDKKEIWKLSFIATFLLLGNIFLVGYLQHNSGRIRDKVESPPIIDLTTLNRFVNRQHIRSDELKIPRAIPVPTGIYIQRLEFEDSYNLNVGGTVWQKYPLDIAEKVEIGFSLPQMSPFAEASYIEEIYRTIVEPKEDEVGYLLVGWEIRVTLRLNLRYGDFPLDKRHINIKFQALNNNDHLIFTPDLVSYNFTNPSKKCGIDPAIEIPGSELLESYYNYSLNSYDVDFGYGNSGLFEEVPILNFNIYLRRILLNAFVTYLIPIFVALIMVFIMVYACRKTQERQGIIESMAAFFFVLIFSHIDLRKEIVTADFIYIEHFYFIAYFMLVLSTYNLITYARQKSTLFDFNENQIFKAAFFPIFLFLIFIITLNKFY